MERWPLIIIAAFAVVFFANGVMIYLATTTADPVVPSYNTDHR